MSYQCLVEGCPGGHVSKHELCVPSSNPLAQICSCTWHDGLREPGIDCPVHPRPAPSKQQFRRAARQIDLLPCRLCGSPAELWQRWLRDDVWESFGACTNIEDVDGQACHFHLPDDPRFYRERRADAAQYWNLIMGPRSADETTTRPLLPGERFVHRGITFQVVDIVPNQQPPTDANWATGKACIAKGSPEEPSGDGSNKI